MAGKRLVVVGGGIAGSLLAKELQSHANVTLIDLKEYFSIPWAMGRAMMDPSLAEKSLINYHDFLPKVHLITSAAIDITDKEIITAKGHTIPYDYLVIATGHEDNSPKSRSTKILHCHQAHDKIAASKSVLIVGGGPGGVELASEIATEYPDEKKVILVHRGSRLLEYIGLKASQKALDWLTSKNVKVILDQTVNLTSFSRDGVIKTSNGETITADCHFDCTGRKIGSMWLMRSVLSDSLDLQGRLMVDENMRVKGRNNVFAIGDITNVPELKQGFLAMRHAEVAAKNLRILMEESGCKSRMASYTASRPLAFVSLGRREGVAQILWFTLCGRFPGLVKSNDLYVGKIRKRYGIQDDNCL